MYGEGIAAKTGIGVVVGVFAYLKSSFNELLVVLALLMISDYILGSLTALIKGEFDYKKGIIGAIKKVGYVFLVVIALLLDYTIIYLTTAIGFALPVKAMFGIAITCYLIGTEGISNIKSLAILGLPIPEFLKKAFGLLKDSAKDATTLDQ